MVNIFEINGIKYCERSLRLLFVTFGNFKTVTIESKILKLIFYFFGVLKTWRFYNTIVPKETILLFDYTLISQTKIHYILIFVDSKRKNRLIVTYKYNEIQELMNFFVLKEGRFSRFKRMCTGWKVNTNKFLSYNSKLIVL